MGFLGINTNILIVIFLTSLALGSNNLLASEPVSAKAQCVIAEADQIILDSIDTNIDVDSFLKYSNDCSSTLLTKFLLSLDRLKKLEFNNVPKNIDNEVTRTLAKPWDFLKSKYFTRFEFEPSGKFVASYAMVDGSIYISNHYFTGDIVEQMSTLVHEAQHSDAGAAWHEACYKGQLIAVAGACDGVLETKIKLAGAYSVEYWFLKLVAEAGHGLFSQKSQEVAKNKTDELIGHRFNHVFDQAQNNDVFVVVTDKNELKAYDPLTKSFVPLDKPFSGGISKVKKNFRNEGFYLFTEDGEMFNWDSVTFGFKSLENYNIEEFQGKIKDFHRVVHPEHKVNRNILLADDDLFYLEGIDDKLEKEYKLTDYGSFVSSHILRKHNQAVLRPNLKVEIINSFFEVINLKNETSPESIVSIFPTHYGSAFYSISSEGLVYYSKILHEVRPGSMGSNPLELHYAIDEFQVPSPAKAVKIVEGGGYRAILDSAGYLYAAAHDKAVKISVGKEPLTPIALNKNIKIKDFTIIRKTVQIHGALLESEAVAKFKKVCKVKNVKLDPWLQRPVGIDEKNRLVVFNLGACQTIADDVIGFEFKSRSMKYSPYGYNSSELWLKYKDGSSLGFKTAI